MYLQVQKKNRSEATSCPEGLTTARLHGQTHTSHITNSVLLLRARGWFGWRISCISFEKHMSVVAAGRSTESRRGVCAVHAPALLLAQAGSAFLRH